MRNQYFLRLQAAAGGDGWGVELDSKAGTDPFATAFAARAYASVHHDPGKGAVTTLVDSCKPGQQIELRAIALLALAELGLSADGQPHWPAFRRDFLHQLGASREYRYTYQFGQFNYYINVPFQLIGLQAAKYFDKPRFWGRPEVQHRLAHLVSCLRSNDGFSYDGEKGPKSLRTYSAIYELFHTAQSVLPRSAWLKVATPALRILDSRLGRLALSIVGTALIILLVGLLSDSSSEVVKQIGNVLLMCVGAIWSWWYRGWRAHE